MKNSSNERILLRKCQVSLVILILALIAVTGYFLTIEHKVKTSVELFETVLIDQSFENLIEDSPEIEKDLFQEHEPFFMSDEITVSQYTVIDNQNDELLVIRTTPGLINHQLVIQEVKVIDSSILTE